MPEPRAPIARVVHRSAERWRLRIPERKRDLDYFIRLYEALRVQPEIREVTVNPITGSLLVWPASPDPTPLRAALTRSGLFQLVDTEADGAAVRRTTSTSEATSRPTAAADATATEQASSQSGAHLGSHLGSHPGTQHAFHVSVNDTRILVFLIMLALSLYQLSKKQFLAPALTMALYLIDLLAGLKLERDAAARVEQASRRESD
jgi:hypothetical protein